MARLLHWLRRAASSCLPIEKLSQGVVTRVEFDAVVARVAQFDQLIAKIDQMVTMLGEVTMRFGLSSVSSDLSERWQEQKR
jgi:hypothetical protein